MSQLDSMLKELKKTLSDDVSMKTAAIGSEMSETEARELIRSQSSALKDFLKSNGSKVSAGVPQENEDPQVIVARRNALSAFVGVPLKNNGKAILTGTISVEAESHANNNGHKAAHEAKKTEAKHELKSQTEAPLPASTPPPQVVLKYVDAPCKKCEEYEKKEKEAAKSGGNNGQNASKAGAASPTSGSSTESAAAATGAIALGGSAASPSGVTSSGALSSGSAMGMPPAAAADSMSGMGNMGFSKPISPRPEAEEKKSFESEERRGEERKSEKDTAKENKTEKKGFGLFNVFGKKDKSDERSKGDERKEDSENFAAASPAPVATEKAKPNVFGSNANAASQVAWFKHIQAIESALRIGDIHFAESLLSLLTEVAHSVAAGGNINARLDSMQARIFIDRKFFGEAEELLNKSIKNAESTPLEKNISIAYCWHALAQCYHAQKKMPEAEKAQKKAVEIATEANGENDPETVLLKAPL